MTQAKRETHKIRPVLNIFDLDHTLFKTFSKVYVVDAHGNLLQALDSTEEYNRYRLQAGEHFDFSDFRDAAAFFKTSLPIEPIVAKLRRYIAASSGPDFNIILTARSDFDDKVKFLELFRKHDISIDKCHVERSGNLAIGTVAAKKRIVVQNYLDYGIWEEGRIRMFDDDGDNLRAFLTLRPLYPSAVFEAYLVHEGGQITTYG